MIRRGGNQQLEDELLCTSVLTLSRAFGRRSSCEAGDRGQQYQLLRRQCVHDVKGMRRAEPA